MLKAKQINKSKNRCIHITTITGIVINLRVKYIFGTLTLSEF